MEIKQLDEDWIKCRLQSIRILAWKTNELIQEINDLKKKLKEGE